MTQPILTTKEKGEPNTLDWRLYFSRRDTPSSHISPWHDIPLYVSDGHGPTTATSTSSSRATATSEDVVNFVLEIPRGTVAKMEVATDEPSNPIKQDTKKGKLRSYAYGPSLCNYGMIPRTWESTNNDPHTGVPGDNDPLDVIEIGCGQPTRQRGEVYPVKVLGVFGLLDEGETDWKVITIDCNDPLAMEVNDVADIDPELIEELRIWFRDYKTAEGKGQNDFAFDGRVLDKSFALQIIEESHENWRSLLEGRFPDSDLWYQRDH